jgi:hypothetical protein
LQWIIFWVNFHHLATSCFEKKIENFLFHSVNSTKKNAEWLSFPALLRVKWCQEFHIGTYCISYLHILKIGFHGQYRIGAIYQNLARNILAWGECIKQVLKCATRQRVSYPICLCNMYMTYIYRSGLDWESLLSTPNNVYGTINPTLKIVPSLDAWILPTYLPFLWLNFSQKLNHSQSERQNLHLLIALFH